MNYNLKMPKDLYVGEGSLKEIKSIVKKLDNVNKILVFTDKGIIKNGLIDEPIKYIQEAKIKYKVLDYLVTEPSYLDAQNIIDVSKKEDPDLIVAIGGGSVMDIAKLASVTNTNDYNVKDLLKNPTLAKKQIPTVMIPTTAGTGSEATPNSIVLIPEKELKVGIVNEEMIADYVLLDPAMIESIPFNIAAATGVDALCHAIECFTSKKANLISDTFALRALDLIVNNIIPASKNESALEEKKAMLLGSFFAGVAITTSGTTAVHALSYPLGGKYHIAHGVSNAMLLIPVMKFNEPEIKDLLAKAYESVTSNDDKTLTTDEKSQKMIDILERIVKELKIPTTLKEYNVTRDDLDSLVSAGMQVDRLLVNNVRKITPDDAKSIYLEII